MGRARLGLDLCKTIAVNRGGHLLSTVYGSNKAPLLWECEKGHQWLARLNSVKDNGSWCPFCAGKRHSGIPAAVALATSRGGECLSDQYTNSKTPLLWRCERGHAWMSSFDNVQNKGSWCPVCAGKQRLTLADAISIAAEKGGELLSKTYGNSLSRMLWRCAEGHEWLASLNSVRNSGSWCRTCAHDQRRLALPVAHDLATTCGGACFSSSPRPLAGLNRVRMFSGGIGVFACQLGE